LEEGGKRRRKKKGVPALHQRESIFCPDKA